MQVGAPTGTVEVNQPIVVKAGQTFDGQGRLFSAGPGLKGGGTAETHLPVFILEPGASVKNLQFKGGDGIHLLGDAKLDNVHGLQTDDDFITVDGAENRAVDAQRAGYSAKSILRARPAWRSRTRRSRTATTRRSRSTATWT